MRLLVILLSLCGVVLSQHEENAKPKNLCNIIDPESVFCYCNYESLGAAEDSTCWVYRSASKEDKAWDYFSTQPKLKSVQFFIRQDGVLDFIPTGPISQLPELQYYRIEHSNITVVEKGIFKGGHELKNIKLDNNKIFEVRHGAFRNLKKLETISLSQNMITKIGRNKFIGLPSLKHLYIDRNNLSEIEDGALLELEKLEQLELYKNQIQNISTETFVGLIHLKRLDLSRNQLEYLDAFIFKDQGNLAQLILSNNQIRFISEDAFTGLSSLTMLNLEDNKLTGLGGEIFKSTPSLHYIDLRQNVLETLTNQIINPIKSNFRNNTMIIRLAGNNLVCDCRIAWMYEIMKDKKVSSFLRNNMDRLRCFLNYQAAAKMVPDPEAPTTTLVDGRYPVYETTTHSLGVHIRLFDIPKDKLPCEAEKTELCVTGEMTPEKKSLETPREEKHKKERQRHHQKHRHHDRHRKKDRRRKNKEEDQSTSAEARPTFVSHQNQPTYTENRPDVTSHEPTYTEAKPNIKLNDYAKPGSDSNLKGTQYTDSQDPKPIEDSDGSTASSLRTSVFLMLVGLFMLR